MDDIKQLMIQEIPRLRRYALTLSSDLGRADDLVQDCLEHAIRKRSQLKKTGSVRAWLFRILYTRFINEQKRHRNARAHVPIDDVEHLLSVRPQQEVTRNCREIIAAFQKLPDEQRAVLAMSVIEGFSYDEIALTLEVPIGTVRSRLSRARETLRTLYQPNDDRTPATVTSLKRVK
ncbi:MAG: sigma-70 family RNA polymerase sigma factor [Rhodospirillales bacterium]